MEKYFLVTWEEVKSEDRDIVYTKTEAGDSIGYILIKKKQLLREEIKAGRRRNSGIHILWATEITRSEFVIFEEMEIS